MQLLVLTLVLVCEYLIKYSQLRPWLFKRPDYEEENPEDGQQDQDIYDNQDLLPTSTIACGTDGPYDVSFAV